MVEPCVRWGGEQFPLRPGTPVSSADRRSARSASTSRTSPSRGWPAGWRTRTGHWWLVNASASRALSVVDGFGLRSVLPPGRRTVLDGPARILIDGVDLTHQLDVVLPPRVQEPAAAVDGVPTSIGKSVQVNDADRAAMVALFAGYLETGTRYDPNPKSYAAAAARLGWPRTTLVKRIEYLRSRLSAAGVPNLTGWNALSNLAEYALTTGLVTHDDLAILRR